MRIYKTSDFRRRLYSFAFRNKYDLSANAIAKMVFQKIKDGFMGEEVIPINNLNKDCVLDLTVRKSPFRTLKHGYFDIFGDSTHDKKKLETDMILIIQLTDRFSEKDYYTFYSVLYEVIRHELEHFDRYFHNQFPPYDYLHPMYFDRNNIEILSKQVHDYVVSFTELDPFVRSIVYSAKKFRIPYEDLIERFVLRAFFNNDKSLQEANQSNQVVMKNVKDARDTLIRRVLEIYPDIVHATSVEI